MAIRPKTKKRLFILLAVSLTLTTALAGFYVIRKLVIHQRILGYKGAGIALLDKGEYPQGLQTLGRYLTRYPTDVEALYRYAKAREQIEEPGGRHLFEALNLLRRVVELAPRHPQARQDLLQLYSLVGYNTEAIQTADAILAVAPNDKAALRAKAVALLRLRRHKDALVCAQKFNQVAPEDVEGYFLTFAILRAMDTPSPTLVAQAEKILQAHPANTQLLLLKGFAYQLNHQTEEALACYRNVAANPATDTALLGKLIGLLDAWGQYAESLTILEEHATGLADPTLRRLYARRLFEFDRLPDLLKFTADQNPAQKTSDSDLLVLRVLAYWRMGKNAEAAPLIEGLSHRADNTAAAWLPVLRQGQINQSTTVDKRIHAAQDGLAHDPRNPYLRFYLAEAYVAQGETPLALRAFNDAFQGAPTWYLPLLRAAEILVISDRLNQAQAMAIGALQRAPKNLAANLTLAEIRLALLKDDDTVAARNLLRFADEIHATIPTDSRANLLRIALLARLDEKASVRTAIDELLTSKDALDTGVLLRLAGLSQRYRLGVEDRVLEVAEKRAGLTPDIALAQASRLAQQNKVAAGRQLLETAAASAPTKLSQAWSIALARYLDRFIPEQSPKAWAVLGDAHADEPQIQRLLLDSAGVWQDRKLIVRTIDRLRKITGEDALSWRVYRARWLLSDNPDSKGRAEAISLLNDSLHANPDDFQTRFLLAIAFEQAHNPTAALEHLNAAAALRPAAASVAIRQAELYQQQGDAQLAVAALGRLPRDVQLSPDEARQAAEIWAALGQPDRALSLLAGLPAQDQSASDPFLTLLYQQTGHADQAQTVIQRMLLKPTAAAIEVAAEFYASSARLAQARQVLEQLDQLQLSPGTRELIRGRFAARHESVELALALFQRATELAPQDQHAWEALLDIQIGQGKTAEALASVAAAAKAMPDQPGYQALVSRPQLISVVVGVPLARPLLYAVLTSEQFRAPALESLRYVQEAWEKKQSFTTIVDQLRTIADLNPRFFGLQTLLVRLYLLAQRYDDAMALAGRIMQAFPAAPEPAELSVMACSDAGRWSEALAAARIWRSRSASDPTNADLAIAEAQIRLGNPKAALTQANPYLAKALTDPNDNAQIILTNARAMISAGQPTKAADLLRPLLGKQTRWAQAWMRLAALAIQDRATAIVWLQEVTPLLPAQDMELRSALGDAWHLLYLHFKENADLQQAQAVFRDLLQHQDLPPQLALSAGLFFDSTGDLSTAEVCYRRCLKTLQNPVAQNNLAMIIINHKGDAAEAVRLAQSASRSAQDRHPPFLDTLAQAYLLAGQPAQAVVSLRQAVTIAPDNPEWMIHLAQALVANGKLADAKTMIAEVTKSYPDPGTLPAPLRQELSDLRHKLGAG